MKCLRYLLILAPLCLAGCGAASTLGEIATGQVANPVSLDTVYKMRTAYDAAFLPAAVYYRHLPRCAPGTSFAIAKPCSELVVIHKIQAADKAVVTALDSLKALAESGDTLTVSASLQTANDAIKAAEDLVTSFKKA